MPRATATLATAPRCGSERDAVARLEAGEETASVLRDMRTVYTTPNSLRTHTNFVRAAYAGPLDDGGAHAASELRALARTPAQRDRVEAVVRDYGRSAARAAARAARWQGAAAEGAAAEGAAADATVGGKHFGVSQGAGGADDARLEAAVARYASALLPRRVRDVHITGVEVRAVERAARDRIRARHLDSPLVDGDAALALARGVVAAPRKHGVYDLALALLLLTGRRTAEVLNGASRFDPNPTVRCAGCGKARDERRGERCDELRGDEEDEARGGDAEGCAACDAARDEAHSCVFAGQLKTRAPRPPRPIPLLAPCAHVVAAVAELRAKQASTEEARRRRASTKRQDAASDEASGAASDEAPDEASDEAPDDAASDEQDPQGEPTRTPRHDGEADGDECAKGSEGRGDGAAWCLARRKVNVCVSRRYQSNLGQRMRTIPAYATARRVHGLRGAYANACVHLFEWGTWTPNAVIMHVLGHCGVEESLAYAVVRVSLCEAAKGSLGPGCR